MTLRTILFPTDFSGRCDRPRARAVQLARQSDAQLVLLHVLTEPDTELMASERCAELEHVEARLRAEVDDVTVTVTTILAHGDVANAILTAAKRVEADLIVAGISRHDEIGDFVVGTTVERLVRHAHAPVLVVKESARQDYQRMMVATDFSDCSAAALRTGLAMFPDAEVTLLHAYSVPLETLRGREGPAAALQAEIAFELSSFVESLDIGEEARERLQVNIDYGPVSQVARDHVRTSDTDLAVVGTRGRTALVAAALGSAARSLLADLECDVLLVRQRGDG
ncbi:universal stress protein [Sphingomonas sp. ABOLG]|uniref:universal stress protein n=1 Tax=Sphingomonas sp. ABOLG TaxID=1985880 RepID=UPI000F7F2F65|nr:universal stress protein [Sphingomonas sp. ABOLG]RSV14787.1 universal stress protein [Sphingomonas sp. ABOLG]